MPTNALQAIPVNDLAKLANKIVKDVLKERAEPAKERKRPRYYDPGSRAGKIEQKRKDQEAEIALQAKAEAADAARKIKEAESPPPISVGRRLGSAPPIKREARDDLSEIQGAEEGGAGSSTGGPSSFVDDSTPATKRHKGKNPFRGAGNRLDGPDSVETVHKKKPVARKRQTKAGGQGLTSSYDEVKIEVDGDYVPPPSEPSAPIRLGTASGKGRKRLSAVPAEDDQDAIRRKRLAAMEARTSVKTEVKTEVA